MKKRNACIRVVYYCYYHSLSLSSKSGVKEGIACIIMYKDGLLFLGKTHINNSCRARRPVADNNKNKNNDINNSYQDRRPPDQKDMIIHIKQSEKRQYRQKQ